MYTSIRRYVASDPAAVIARVREGFTPIIRAMHERHDGTGGPDGLAGDAIPLEARIVAACNAYDLLVSGLVAPQRAVATLRTAQTGRFDPRVVEALASMADAGGAPARSTDPQPRRDRISN